MSLPAKGLWLNSGGAIAPTVALSLTMLIAVGGIAFDYSRMASLDTELQQAADQAALAAATQLDGQGGACARAALAANSMLANDTLLSNDGGGKSIVIPNEGGCDATGSIRFYQDIAKTVPATSNANARFVEVFVNPRQVNFALTPIVAAMDSGMLNAAAYAGLDSAICKTPPVMICNPQETGVNTNFDYTALVGVGIRLTTVGNGSGTWAPGNFGYLNSQAGVSGVPALRQALGWENLPGDCIAGTGVNTKPGASVNVTDALNTRFDIYDSNVSCPSGGNCGASINSVKDVARNANASGGNSCRLHTQGWREGTTATAYGWGTIPGTVAALPTTTTPSVMGHPPDICHAVRRGGTVAGRCDTPIGNGNWDRDAYFRVNYGWNNAQWVANTGLTTSTTRYQVYKWEMNNRGNTIGGKVILNPRIVSGSGPSAFTSYGKPVCSPAQGFGTGVIPNNTNVVDRRVISVAVVNCIANGVKGSSTNVPVQDWIDAFLVQPAVDRGTGGNQVSNAGEIYVEIIGRTQNATDEGATQLVKKSVPYLIE